MSAVPSSSLMTSEANKETRKDNRRKLVFAFLLLLFSLGCMLCSSQVALLTVNRHSVEGSMRSLRNADYGAGSQIALAPLDEKIADEAARDEALLLSKQTPIVQGIGIVMLPNPSPTLIPAPTSTPTLTPTVAAPSEPPPATSQPEPTSVAVLPSTTLIPPTATPVPPTATPIPPTATAIPPTATPAPPTTTPAPPTATSVPPTSTNIPPTATTIPPTVTPVPPTATPVPTSPPPPPTSPPATPANQPPDVAADGPIVIDEDTSASIRVLTNDMDPDGALNPGTVQVISGPVNGSIGGINPASGEIIYIPNPNFNGTDSFTYQVCDDEGACNAAPVTIIVNPVNDAPTAVADGYTTPEDTALSVPAPGVLGNDVDIDSGDTLSAVQVSNPANGTLALNPDGSFIYTPSPDFFGIDSFNYQACDIAGACSPTSVTVTVLPVNDPPIAVDDLTSTAEDTSEVIAVLANDTDVDGPDPLAVVSISSPTNGTVTNNGASITYIPNPDFYGTDTFDYTISDGLDTATATVTVTVEPVNDAPVAAGDAYTLNLSTDPSLSVGAPGVLANDLDVDGNPLTATLESGPANGALVLNPDGSFLYAPNGGFTGPQDSFTYRTSDGLLNSANVATVTITINP